MNEFIIPRPNHLIPLQPQPDFPKKDVSEENVPYLAFVLTNQEARIIAHETAERAARMYTMAHTVLTRVHKWSSAFSEKDSNWIGVGVTQYEAISGLLRVGEDNSHLNSIATPYGLQRRIESNDYNDYFQDAYADFCTETPNLEGLITDITTTTTNAPRSAIELALYGAAIQRKNELDALTTQANVESDAILGVGDTYIPSLDLLEQMIIDPETM